MGRYNIMYKTNNNDNDDDCDDDQNHSVKENYVTYLKPNMHKNSCL